MNTHTYFKSPEGEKAIMTFYDSMLAQWPVPYETHQIDTGLGPTFVIASGEKTAPPLMLLHGSTSNSLTWAGDVAAYSRYYRVYAVDTPGEPGKSPPQSKTIYQHHSQARWCL